MMSQNPSDENSSMDEIFGSTSCPKMDKLFEYAEGKLSSDEQHQVEKHLVDCDLCFSFVESIPSVGSKETLQRDIARLNKRIDAHASADAPSDHPPLTTSLRASALRVSVLAACIIVILYGVLWFSGRLTLTSTYEMASIDKYRPQLLELKNIGERTLAAPTQIDLSKGAFALLSADRSWMGLFPSYDEKEVQIAIENLEKAFESDTTDLGQARISFYIAKAYLMQNNASKAKDWLRRFMEFEVTEKKADVQLLLRELEGNNSQF